MQKITVPGWIAKANVVAVGFAFAGGAHAFDAFNVAGTSVSISGRVSAGVDVTSNVAKPDGSSGSVTRGASNQWGTSLATIAATRDVGGGNTAYATLESGFGADRGISNDGTLWSRRSFVGVKNEHWGRLQFGKNLSISNNVWYIDPMGQNWSGSASLVGGRNWAIAPGAIEYGTPSFGGFSVTVQHSPGGKVGSSKVGSRTGIDLTYNKGPVDFHFIHDVAANSDNGRYDNIFNASKETIVGGSYQLGAAKLFLGFNYLSAPDADGITQARKAQQAWVGVNYKVSDPLLLRAAYYTGGTSIDYAANVDPTKTTYGGKSGKLLVLGVDYAINAQFMVWATLSTVWNGEKSNYSSGTYWDTLPQQGKNQNTFNTGLVFSF